MNGKVIKFLKSITLEDRVDILLELIERKRDQIYDNPKDNLFKQHLASLRCSIELIEEDIPYLDPNY